MVLKKYIVLRTETPFVPSFDNLGVSHLGASILGAAPRNLEVEEAELTQAERADLRRDPTTMAVAESMPMKLIEPVAFGDSAEPMSSNITWGIKAVNADQSPFSGAGITVAVLDTGIDPTHPAFQGVSLVRKNFTSETDNDLVGHGTHCAGTIFGQDVNNIRIGIARNVRKALIGKVLGQGGGSSAIIAKAIQWAVNEGAHVISMSLGIDFAGFVKFLIEERGLAIEPATSIALEQYRANVNLFTELADFVRAQGSFLQGSVIIAASGNESDRPNYEIGVAPPAAGTGVIAVGALEETPNGFGIAPFSNNQVNISAPGVNVVSAFLGGGLRSLSGTSMATPHVAGVAALWAQKQLDESGRVNNEALASRLIGSGNRSVLVPGAEAEDTGTGIVQAPVS
tara:strand:- start:1562 stop:2755 length:1194 start_codon:yes stop_codon:yes gene_type:complete